VRPRQPPPPHGVEAKDEAVAAEVMNAPLVDRGVVVAADEVVGAPQDQHGVAVQNLGARIADRAGAVEPPPSATNGEMNQMLAHMDILQHTMMSLAGCVASVEVKVEGHETLTATMANQFDEICDLPNGLDGGGRGVAVGRHAGRLPPACSRVRRG
jgi:hypothetical protein